MRSTVPATVPSTVPSTAPASEPPSRAPPALHDQPTNCPAEALCRHRPVPANDRAGAHHQQRHTKETTMPPEQLLEKSKAVAQAFAQGHICKTLLDLANTDAERA